MSGGYAEAEAASDDVGPPITSADSDENGNIKVRHEDKQGRLTVTVSALVSDDSGSDVIGSGMRAIFDTEKGCLSQLQLLGRLHEGDDSDAAIDLLGSLQEGGTLEDDQKENSRRSLGLQFHRAPTDNDRGGYVGQWDAAGLLGPALGPFDSRTSWKEDADAVIVTTEFTLKPRAPKPRFCRLLYKLRDFRDEAEKQASATPPPSIPPGISFTGLREDEVSFVRALAAAWRLGHAPEDDKESGSGVRVWFPSIRLNSTHDLAAGMSVAPESGISGDEDGAEGAPGDEEVKQEGEEDETFDAGEFACWVRYKILATGVVTVECDVSMPEHWPVIPRTGLRILLPGSFSNLEWYGRGPHENYSDRKASAAIHRFASDVSKQLTPYIRPGECGAKVDVRWLEVSASDAVLGKDVNSTASNQQPAVLFSALGQPEQGAKSMRSNDEQRSFAFSALAYLAEDLAEQMHPEALSPRPITAVNLDHKLMGAGGDDSWSACVHDEFLVRPGRFRFGFAMAPYWRISGSVDEIGGGILSEAGEQATACWRKLKRLSMGD